MKQKTFNPLWIVGIVIIIIVMLFYFVEEQKKISIKNDKESKACIEAFLDAIGDQNYEMALNYVCMPEEGYVKPNHLKYYANHSKLKSVIIEPKYISSDKYTKTSKSIRYLITNNLDMMTIETKKNENGQWRVYLDDFVIENWYVKIPGNATMNINDEKIKNKYLEVKGIPFDIYKIPSVPKMKINIDINDIMLANYDTEIIPTQSKKEEPDEIVVPIKEKDYNQFFKEGVRLLKKMTDIYNKKAQEIDIEEEINENEINYDMVFNIINPKIGYANTEIKRNVINYEIKEIEKVKWDIPAVISEKNTARLYISAKIEWDEILEGKKTHNSENRIGWIEIKCMGKRMYLSDVSKEFIQTIDQERIDKEIIPNKQKKELERLKNKTYDDLIDAFLK